jgi:cytochrome c oxidase assembly protein subunit 11
MQQSTKPDNSALIKKLVLIVIGMFGFGFALVPLYDVFCDITGLNGKTNATAASTENISENKSRTINIQFLAITNKNMPWQFKPVESQVQVYPGEVKLVNFYAQNNSIKDLVGQAVPSVSPGQAASYFNKIECFCFNRQPLKAGANTLMPLTFYVDEDLPLDIETLTLSYTMYDVTSAEATAASQSSLTGE